MLMEQLLIYVALVLIGLCMGSFAGATVWRLRARQLVDDKANGEEVSEKEYKTLLPLMQHQLTADRSRCLHCGHILKWYDLIPLISWTLLRGKCRYCHRPIGWLEPLIELGMASLFLISYIVWPYPLQTPLEAMHFVLWLVAIVLLVMLFVYDLEWFLLPNVLMFPLIGISLVVTLLIFSKSSEPAAALVTILGAVVLLSGLYFLLWIASKGRWIGFGDVKLGLALALLLSDWQLAFIALFAANVIGCLIVIPAMIAGTVTRKTRVPFGPLLIIGMLIAFFFGSPILQWYFATLV